MQVRNQFQAWDYVVFSVVLLISASIGMFYGCTGGRQKTTKEFLMADRSMTMVPVALSLLASFMSAITLLGNPAEVYLYGTVYWYIWVGYLLLMPVAAFVFLPMFYRLKLNTINEYLELRFHRSLRVFTAIIFLIQMVLYMSIVLYAPSLALNQVTGLNVWISVFSVGLVCTFYTTLGGLKAVIWTDAFQICIMFAGLIAVLIQGSIDFGGFGEIWRRNEEGGRLDLESWDLSPFRRHTFWTLSVGGFFTWLAVYGTNQAQIQRALSTRTLRQAQMAMLINVPGLTALLTLTCLCGMVIYAQYQNCDPIANGDVAASDQLLPFYVMDGFHTLEGLPGLFTACIFSGALSTVSSGLNSLAAVTLEDILKVACLKELSEIKMTYISKALAAGFGLLSIALTFVAARLGSVLQAALGLFGMLGGPVLGVFTLGILCPCANTVGAFAGMISSLVITLWVGIGAIVHKPANPRLNYSTAGCVSTLPNITNLTNFTVNQTSFTDTFNFNITTAPSIDTQSADSRDVLADWYSLSYLHYATLAVITTLVVGVTVSLITGSRDLEDVDPDLQTSLTDTFCCYLPEASRRWCRLFVPIQETEEDSLLCCYKRPQRMTDTKSKTALNGHIDNPLSFYTGEESTKF